MLENKFVLSPEKSPNVSSYGAGKSCEYLCHVIPWAGSLTLSFNLKQSCLPAAAKLHEAAMQALLCRDGREKTDFLSRATGNLTLAQMGRCSGRW